jgi:hypothetical protein
MGPRTDTEEAWQHSSAGLPQRQQMPLMRRSRSNMADVIRQPSLFRRTSTTAAAMARPGDGGIALSAISVVRDLHLTGLS